MTCAKCVRACKNLSHTLTTATTTHTIYFQYNEFLLSNLSSATSFRLQCFFLLPLPLHRFLHPQSFMTRFYCYFLLCSKIKWAFGVILTFLLLPLHFIWLIDNDNSETHFQMNFFGRCVRRCVSVFQIISHDVHVTRNRFRMTAFSCSLSAS